MPAHLQTKLRPFTKPCLESGWVKQDSQARIKDKKQPIPLILKQLILASVVFSFKKKNKSIASCFLWIKTTTIEKIYPEPLMFPRGLINHEGLIGCLSRIQDMRVELGHVL